MKRRVQPNGFLSIKGLDRDLVLVEDSSLVFLDHEPGCHALIKRSVFGQESCWKIVPVIKAKSS
ncbi:MAG TPA: hypothetical protein EYG38_04695 [Verrucomicrobia bacterium]|nr:hypothetical protein [Verrucomicrobiota bacterium]